MAAIASKIIQSVDAIEVTLPSYMVSSLCMKSDFTHETNDLSSLKMLKGTGAFSNDSTLCSRTFLKDLTANNR